LAGILIGFAAVMAAAVYWAVLGPETILQEPVNYRLRDAAASLIRGMIVDRGGSPLVESYIGDDGFIIRQTADVSLFSLTGYSSRQYGVGGAEAVYDGILRGTDQTENFAERIQHDVLHIPRKGNDIRLTIDLEIQKAAASTLASVGRPGGIVVMDAQSGEILALASAPTVDPAQLDTQWATLIENPDKPFVNRATQGRYVAGSALGVAVLTAWIIDGRTLDDVLALERTQAAVLCGPDDGEITVREAFIYSCANALSEMVELLGPETFETTASLFGLRAPVPLDGFTLGPRTDSTPEIPESSEAIGADTSRLLPLGAITRSPLDLAEMIAAIANQGNAPQPILLDATRAPGSQTWITMPRTAILRAVTTAQTAALVADTMRESAQEGLASSETCAGTDIGAVIGAAETTEGTQVFFVGFAQLSDGHTVVVALAIEGITITRAADVAAAGNAVLCASIAGFADG